MLRSRWFPGFPRTPFVPGADIVGVVDKLGDGVTTFAEGQTVTGGPLRDNGGYVEFVCLPAAAAVLVPDGIDPVAAVCLVVNYLTAHIALHRSARVVSGERVLIHGAAGGVGTALLELGRRAGLEMYATASDGLSLPEAEAIRNTLEIARSPDFSEPLEVIQIINREIEIPVIAGDLGAAEACQNAAAAIDALLAPV